jgi:hypothetical protein
MAYSEKYLKDAHIASMNHGEELKRPQACGCYYCLTLFNTTDIVDTCQDETETALCPYCYIDTVLVKSSGFPLTKEFLQAMRERWF